MRKTDNINQLFSLFEKIEDKGNEEYKNELNILLYNQFMLLNKNNLLNGRILIKENEKIIEIEINIKNISQEEEYIRAKKLSEHNEKITTKISNAFNKIKNGLTFWKEVLIQEKEETKEIIPLLFKIKKTDEDKLKIKEQLTDLMKLTETMIVTGGLPGGVAIQLSLIKIVKKIKPDFDINVSSVEDVKRRNNPSYDCFKM